MGHGLHSGRGGEYFRTLQQSDKSSDGKGPREIRRTFTRKSGTYLNVENTDICSSDILKVPDCLLV